MRLIHCSVLLAAFSLLLTQPRHTHLHSSHLSTQPSSAPLVSFLSHPPRPTSSYAAAPALAPAHPAQRHPHATAPPIPSQHPAKPSSAPLVSHPQLLCRLWYRPRPLELFPPGEAGQSTHACRHRHRRWPGAVGGAPGHPTRRNALAHQLSGARCVPPRRNAGAGACSVLTHTHAATPSPSSITYAALTC